MGWALTGWTGLELLQAAVGTFAGAAQRSTVVVGGLQAMVRRAVGGCRVDV